jgi:cytochrome bd-type quinol oxidase subunit 2
MYDAASCNNSHLIILVVALVWVIFTLLYFVSIYELFGQILKINFIFLTPFTFTHDL